MPELQVGDSERRRARRRGAGIQVILGILEPQRGYVPLVRFAGEIADLSVTGMQIRIHPISAAEFRSIQKESVYCSARAQLPGTDREIELVGCVVWMKRNEQAAATECHVGVRLDDLNAETHEALLKALKTLESESAGEPGRRNIEIHPIPDEPHGHG